MSNIYVLKIRKSKDSSIRIGSIGVHDFPEGWYGYIGSSRTKEFKRVDRHAEISKGEKNTKHWHIDYLLNETDTKVLGYFCSRDALECGVASHINLKSVEDFGSSDCDCSSHLVHSDEEEGLIDEIEKSFNSFNGYNYKNIET